NYQLWAVMVALGLNGAVSVRVSNELGANKPKAARFSVIIAVSTSAAIGAVFLAVFLAWRTELPRFFSDNEEVVSEAAKLGYLLAATIFLNSIQPVLTGVVIGAGWQTLVAFINIGCYYLVGIPLGFLFGFKLKLGALVRTKSNQLPIWNGQSDSNLCSEHTTMSFCREFGRACPLARCCRLLYFS
uniref:Protein DETOXIFICATION n=1 Tax=Aegilops tauschii subsp. strangulata TaxID=200361 RepID=A0A453HCB9_AEGTS